MKYLDENGEEQTADNVAVIDNQTAEWSGGWYVVNSDVEISDRITLKVTVPADDVAKVEQFKDLVAHDTSSDSVSVEAGAELGVEVAKV